jgi:hypothetical protein
VKKNKTCSRHTMLVSRENGDFIIIGNIIIIILLKYYRRSCSQNQFNTHTHTHTQYNNIMYKATFDIVPHYIALR